MEAGQYAAFLKGGFHRGVSQTPKVKIHLMNMTMDVYTTILNFLNSSS